MPNYQLSISNIAWHKEDDEAVYTAMQQAGFTGLELAPTRIFSETPYENLTSALLFGGYLKNRWGFSVPSLQSIWYGQQGNIFNAADTEPLLDYTAQAFQFAHSLNCPSLVFGCPKNRMRPLRDVFGGYELLAYLSIRATQLGMKACEVPVTRAYPATGKTPTKITGFKGNSDLMKILLNALAGKYNP